MQGRSQGRRHSFHHGRTDGFIHGRTYGFTLIEMLVVMVLLAIVAAAALPSFRGQQLRMARLDGVQALSAVQHAQERHRALHGLYAPDLAALRGVAGISAAGRYTLALAGSGADGYRATAAARGLQLEDRDCPLLSLEVRLGFAQQGPAARCWNR